MAQVNEIIVPGGVLRVEVERAENDQVASITAYLNGEPVTRERAQALIQLARSRVGKVSLPHSRSVVFSGDFPLTPREWDQLMARLEAMKPGFVTGETETGEAVDSD